MVDEESHMADGKFSGECRQEFLRELTSTGHIYHACRVAGISYQTMHRHRKGGKYEDLQFEEDYLQAMGNYVGMLKAEAQRRAIEGWDERPVIDKDGNIVGQVRKFSDTLLLALLRRSDEGYKDRVQVDAKTTHEGEVVHTHTHGAELEQLYKNLEPEEQEAWKEVLRAIARVSAAAPPSGDAPPKSEQH